MSVLRCLTWTTRLDKILEEVQPGDLVRFHRGLFIHHAVYTGRGRAVHHHLGDCDGEVIEATLEYLAKGDLMKVFKVADTPFAPLEIVRRARGQIGPLPYSLHGGNCEHFTSWVYHGVRVSRQLSGLCRHELRLLRVVKHGGGSQAEQREQQEQRELQELQEQRHEEAAASKRQRSAKLLLDDDDRMRASNSTDEAAAGCSDDDSSSSSSSFTFVPPRPPKYRHTKNPARIACNHARSCLKVLAIQSVVGLAAVPLYKCSLQADGLQRLAGQLKSRARARERQQDGPSQAASSDAAAVAADVAPEATHE